MIKCIDSILLEPEEHETLDFVETNSKTFHISPAIELKAGSVYSIQIFEDGTLTIWERILSSKTNEAVEH